ncbi:CPBP family intramembrane metalloprotease [Candidatus Collierbacteria bacterium]|nr:CPBP family intramembrane metalloprotease [Candidatus Collierbacteria bacterium]
MPDVIEELWFKPVIWLVPLCLWWIGRGGKPELFKGNLLKAVLAGVTIGVVYWLLIRTLTGKGDGIYLSWAAVSLVTATVEEITFTGVILGILIERFKSVEWSLGLVAIAFALIHLPINLFVYQLKGAVLIGSVLIGTSAALINGWLRIKTNNTWSAIIAHFIYLLAAA